MDQDGKEQNSHFALNEVVAERRTTNVVKLDVYVNKVFSTTLNCDGLLVASSTGSTAYNSSLANGVMMHPEVECIILNPIGSINLSSRPLILSKHHEIMIKVSLAWLCLSVAK